MSDIIVISIDFIRQPSQDSQEGKGGKRRQEEEKGEGSG